MYGEIMSLQSDIHEKVVEDPSMETYMHSEQYIT